MYCCHSASLQNSIPPTLTLRQSDLYWSFQLAPSKAYVQSTTKGAETAIDSRGRESGILGRKVLSLLIVNLVERLRRPVTFLNHFHAIGVLFDGSGLGDVLRFHKGHKIIRQRVCQ
jgi:hypothetical protein